MSDGFHLLVISIVWFCARKDRKLMEDCLNASISVAGKALNTGAVAFLEGIQKDIKEKLGEVK